MRWINLGFSVLMLTLIGSIGFLLWKMGSKILERQGRIRGIRMGLILTIAGFWLPAAFLFRSDSAGALRGIYEEDFIWKTPALVLSVAFLVLVWAGGALFTAVGYLVEKRRMAVLLRKGRTAGEEIREMAEEIRKKLGIRRRISVYTAEGLSGPFITGVWNCRVFLPEKIYRTEDLKMILEHEFWHYKQGDLLLKSLCVGIFWIQWFNPLAGKLSAAVDQWGNIHCDLHMCCRRSVIAKHN